MVWYHSAQLGGSVDLGFNDRHAPSDNARGLYQEARAGCATAGSRSITCLASITLSQAILESDWGKSTNATENNNLFGVKSASGRLMTTQEYYDGAYHTVKRRFAVYDSWHASLVDHAKKLAYGTTWDSQHYAAVIKATDYQTAAQALQTAGYATDPSYAQKLINIIQKYDLQRYDRK
jgi:flagellum-specific peptidoglycan hydrolase FlgJ